MRVMFGPIGVVAFTCLLGKPLLAQEAGPVPARPSTQAAQDSALEQSVKEFSDAATKLSKAGAELTAAADKLSNKPEEKSLASGRLPWNGALLKFTKKEKRVTAAFSTPIDSGTWTLAGAVDAPLDSDARLAALVDPGRQPLPFQLKLSIEYNSMVEPLKSLLEGNTAKEQVNRQFRAFCAEPDRDCSKLSTQSDEFASWTKEKLGLGRSDGISARPVPLKIAYALGGEIEAGYDRQKVYVADLALKPSDRALMSLNFGGVLRLYPKSWLAIPLKIGASLQERFQATKTKRCESNSSSSVSVSGQACEDVLVANADSTIKISAYFDAAMVFSLPLRGDYTMAPGIEVRNRVDGLGDVGVNRFSIALFASPTSEPVLYRFGVGLENDTALNDDSAASPQFRKGDSWLVPFVLAGGTL